MAGTINLTNIETGKHQLHQFLDRIEPYCVDQDSFELMILLPQFLECWNYVCHHTQVQFPFLKQQMIR